MVNKIPKRKVTPGAHQGFPVGGGGNPPGGATYDYDKFSKNNCMELRIFWAIWGGGGGRGAP